MPSARAMVDDIVTKAVVDYGCAGCSRFMSEEDLAMHMKNKQIEKELKEEKQRLKKQVKLLLLGAGESGKSTFLKQMKIIHGVVFEPEQIKEYRQIIYQNMITGMRVLVDALWKLGIDMEKQQNIELGNHLLAFDNIQMVNESNFGALKPVLKSLWNDRGIREAFDRRNEFQISDSVEYFFNDLDRLSDQRYVPSLQDILYCRKRTKSIIEFPLTIEDVPFLFVDVGGQRTQRQKWFQCFDSVTSILFIASSSEFDQALLEDPSVNRLEESRNIFDTIVNHRVFASISFILFLNKIDLLEAKIARRKSDISEHFPEEFANVKVVRSYVQKFDGDPFDVADVKSFILYLFACRQRRTNAAQQLYHHFTTAVDTKNIRYVFNSVKETVLRKNLSSLMLE